MFKTTYTDGNSSSLLSCFLESPIHTSLHLAALPFQIPCILFLLYSFPTALISQVQQVLDWMTSRFSSSLLSVIAWSKSRASISHCPTIPTKHLSSSSDSESLLCESLTWANSWPFSDPDGPAIV